MHTWRRLLQQACSDVAAALFPGACRGCGTELPCAAAPVASRPAVRRVASLWDGSFVRRLPGGLPLPSWFACPSCAAALQAVCERSRLGDVDCIAVFAPSPLLFELVHAFKYEAQLQLGAWFGRWLAVALRARLGSGCMLLPVPSHASRVRERGFDASAVLAGEAAQRSGAALAPGCIERRRATPPQARLTHAARAANVAGAFARSGRAPAGGRIVVLDDVVTTGATVGAVLSTLALPPARTAVVTLCRARV
jgi:predicted amidophosphoribosyltransferase